MPENRSSDYVPVSDSILEDESSRRKVVILFYKVSLKLINRFFYVRIRLSYFYFLDAYNQKSDSASRILLQKLSKRMHKSREVSSQQASNNCSFNRNALGCSNCFNHIRIRFDERLRWHWNQTFKSGNFATD